MLKATKCKPIPLQMYTLSPDPENKVAYKKRDSFTISQTDAADATGHVAPTLAFIATYTQRSLRD